MNLPNPPEGQTPVRSWLRKLTGWARANEIREGIGYTLNRSTSGVSLNIQPNGGNPVARLFPFKIYQFPRGLRVFLNANDDQRFMVRAGNVYDGAVYQSVLGTDRYEYPGVSTDAPVYLTNLVPPNNANAWDTNWNEVIIPKDGNTYFFWISLVAAPSGGPEVLFGLDVASAVYMKDGTAASGDEVWSDFPVIDPYHIPIGNVTWIAGPPERWEIHQFIRQDINGRDPCNLGTAGFVGLDSNSIGQLPPRFVGFYDAGASYWIGDVVLVDDGDFRSQYILCPPFASTYTREAGPLIGVPPDATGDPWLLLSKSPLPGEGVYATGAYDGSKDYQRRA